MYSKRLFMCTIGQTVTELVLGVLGIQASVLGVLGIQASVLGVLGIQASVLGVLGIQASVLGVLGIQAAWPRLPNQRQRKSLIQKVLYE